MTGVQSGGEMAEKNSYDIGTGVASTHAPLQVLRLQQVCKVTGLCRSMVYQLEAERRFPRRIKIGRRAVGWIETEVQAWLSGRIEESRRIVDGSPRRSGLRP